MAAANNHPGRSFTPAGVATDGRELFPRADRTTVAFDLAALVGAECAAAPARQRKMGREGRARRPLVPSSLLEREGPNRAWRAGAL